MRLAVGAYPGPRVLSCGAVAHAGEERDTRYPRRPGEWMLCIFKLEAPCASEMLGGKYCECTRVCHKTFRATSALVGKLAHRHEFSDLRSNKVKPAGRAGNA